MALVYILHHSINEREIFSLRLISPFVDNRKFLCQDFLCREKTKQILGSNFGSKSHAHRGTTQMVSSGRIGRDACELLVDVCQRNLWQDNGSFCEIYPDNSVRRSRSSWDAVGTGSLGREYVGYYLCREGVGDLLKYSIKQSTQYLKSSLTWVALEAGPRWLLLEICHDLHFLPTRQPG